MHHQVAVRRLRKVAERCQRVIGIWDDQPVLLGAYAFGAVLDSRADVPAVQLAFVLNLPPEQLTWCVEPETCSGLPHLLEIDKAPVEWYWRPAAWPVWNHYIRRPLRIWSLEGPDTAALDALERGTADELRMPAPASAEEREQLAAELAASLAHLRRVEKDYWAREWRSERTGYGVYPENYLWNAVHGYLDLLAAAPA